MSEALQVLLSDGVIEEIIGRLKSGKEADVHLVVHKGEIVAAKIYKERDHRNFRNNADYKEGRQVRNSRTARAIAKGSRFGQAAAEDAWKTTEADALYKLHAAGVRVPTPVMYYEGVLLMEVVVDPEGHPAPRLIDAALDVQTAGDMYRDLRAQVVRMLCQDVIHGDLSPYNILMGWNGPNIIDFPQMVNAAANSRAEFFFKRDLENLRRFFAGMDPALNGRSSGDAHDIWRAYTRRELTPEFEPSGRPAPLEERQFRGPPREHRGPPREHSGAPREHRGPPREHRPMPPPEAPPAPAAAPEEDEFALLRQGGGERPRVQDLAKAKGGNRNSRGGPRNGRGGPGGHAPRGPQQGSRPNGNNGQNGHNGHGPRASQQQGQPPAGHAPRGPRQEQHAQPSGGHAPRSPRQEQHAQPSGGHVPRGPRQEQHTQPSGGRVPRGPRQEQHASAPREHQGPRQPHAASAHASGGPRQDSHSSAPREHRSPRQDGHNGRPQGQGPRNNGGRNPGPKHPRGNAGPVVTYVAKPAPVSASSEGSRAQDERQQG